MKGLKRIEHIFYFKGQIRKKKLKKVKKKETKNDNVKQKK